MLNTHKILYDEMQTIKKLLLKKEIPDEYPENISKVEYRSASDIYYIDRFDFANISSFALVTKKLAKRLAEYIGDRECLEIMAGKGVLSKCLSDCGVKITATDDFSWKWHRSRERKGGAAAKGDELWYDVENIDCVEAIEKYWRRAGFVICSWPPYEKDYLYKSLIKMRESNDECKLIYIGEGPGGCTADSSFFNEAKFILNDDGFNGIKKIYQSWYAMNDEIFLIE